MINEIDSNKGWIVLSLCWGSKGRVASIWIDPIKVRTMASGVNSTLAYGMTKALGGVIAEAISFRAGEFASEKAHHFRVTGTHMVEGIFETTMLAGEWGDPRFKERSTVELFSSSAADVLGYSPVVLVGRQSGKDLGDLLGRARAAAEALTLDESMLPTDGRLSEISSSRF